MQYGQIIMQVSKHPSFDLQCSVRIIIKVHCTWYQSMNGSERRLKWGGFTVRQIRIARINYTQGRKKLHRTLEKTNSGFSLFFKLPVS